MCVMAHAELTAILETSQDFSPTIRPTSAVRNSSERVAPITWGCRVSSRAKQKAKIHCGNAIIRFDSVLTAKRTEFLSWK